MFERLSTTREPLICHGHYLLPKKCYRSIRWRGNRVREAAWKKDSWVEYLVNDDEIGPVLDARIVSSDRWVVFYDRNDCRNSHERLFLPYNRSSTLADRGEKKKKKITICYRKVARCANGKNPICRIFSNAIDLVFNLDPVFRIFFRLFAADINMFRGSFVHIAKPYVEEDILQLRIWLSTIVRVRVLI